MLCFVLSHVRAQHWQYVDPRIGSEGVGRTFPGPSMPFGMVKPGPDCGVSPNAGWAPIPKSVLGFSQTHVSGTGGGQKYGNVLIQPMIDNEQEQRRVSEDISLGYYATTYENGIRTEITTSERCALYRFHYPRRGSLFIDATHFLGKNPITDLREAQQFVGAELEVVNNHEVCGYTRIRGGWNNGDAYTVYFVLRSDVPFSATADNLSQRVWLQLADTIATIRVGVSFVSTMQARRNIIDTPFDEQIENVRMKWERLLCRVHLQQATECDKRMFYTALYHTMLMPVDRTGENPKWTDTPYFDDYYAIWDTYRTSSPLITLIAPDRQRDIIHSLLNIYRREGYLPDARSGDCNGRTQGGSNAEVVIADAYVKHLEGIDYELALEAMLKDATMPPGGNEEKEGRGGLQEYNTLGYIPYGIPRAGNRTVEYAFNDYCIAQVAQGLGDELTAQHYMVQSQRWRNLWREDFEWDGMKGFIMPRDAEGKWLDQVPWGKSRVFHPTITYTPVTKVAPWYIPWWDTFFYEATSEEYSLSVPHDVPGLIEACGGNDAFRNRLDALFDKGYYNVANEPSFLTPCLYHWIDRPDLSSDCVHQIINDNYSDTPNGLPGNDDSGAMSSWLAFHQLGLYPNAGHDYYLLHLPLVKEYTFHLSNGKTLHAVIKGKGSHFDGAQLNGEPLPNARITHDQLMSGGELVFLASKAKKGSRSPVSIPKSVLPTSMPTPPLNSPSGTSTLPVFQGEVSYTLNRQFRTWPLVMAWDGDTLHVTVKSATYRIPREVAEHAAGFAWDSPQVDGALYHPNGTFCFISMDALRQLKTNGFFIYDQLTWRLVGEEDGLSHVRADIDNAEMWISTTTSLPLVMKMAKNKLNIDWILP